MMRVQFARFGLGRSRINRGMLAHAGSMRFTALLLLCIVLSTAARPANDFFGVVQENFTAWDLNHDGILSEAEIDTAVANDSITGTNAAAIAALKRATRLAPPTWPPLTLENIAALVAQPKVELAKMYRESWERIASITNQNLFAPGQPRLEAIQQGKLGNCFCLAPLGAMVHRHPADVAALFAVTTNGEYTVRLGKKTVEVTSPTEAEIAMTSANEQAGIWVNLYEKAVGMARNGDRPESARYDSPLDALARGGSAGSMLAYITGHEIERFSFKFAKLPESDTNPIPVRLAELRLKLSAAVQENRLMTTGTLKPTTPDLNPNHAYAVLGYDATTDLVQLWNPHGQNFTPAGPAGPEHGYVTANGIFQIPVREFVKQFSGMAFEVAPIKTSPATVE